MRIAFLGTPDFAVNAILTLSFGVCGPLFWKRVQRWSPGVAAVAGGFVAWGAVFPVGALVQHFYPALVVNGELWNVPKFFVAIGMVLTALLFRKLDASPFIANQFTLDRGPRPRHAVRRDRGRNHEYEQLSRRGGVLFSRRPLAETYVLKRDHK